MKIHQFLDQLSNWFCNKFPSTTKEGDVAKGVLFIMAICAIAAQLVFWLLSALTGLSIWIFWMCLLTVYVGAACYKLMNIYK